MKSIIIGINHNFIKSIIRIGLIILVLLPLVAHAATADRETEITKEQRDDGLTIVLREPSQPKEEIQYLTLILKTGYAHDPAGKYGLTNLTNELIHYLFKRTGALQVESQTYADYSAFHFVVTRSGFNEFCSQLDRILRTDALLLYDLCNEITRYHLNLPKTPELKGLSQFYSLVYGPNHPYNSVFSSNYDQLDIVEVNKWFRQIYKPNNLIIATSIKLPIDFLRRPAGRDLKEAVAVGKISPAAANPNYELKWAPVRDNCVTVCLGFEAAKFGEEGVFATLLLEKYLNQRLWKIIREDHGLSYDPGVYYQLNSKSSAPLLQVALHTIAADTGTVINLILTEFKKIAAEGIPEEELTKIKEQERKRLELIEKDQESVIRAAALFGLSDQKWLINTEGYLTQLAAEAKIVPLVMTKGLARLKVSVAGPEDTGEYLNRVMTMEPLQQK